MKNVQIYTMICVISYNNQTYWFLWGDPWPQLPTTGFKLILYSGNDKLLQYLLASAKLPELQSDFCQTEVEFFCKNNVFQPLTICTKGYVRCFAGFQNPAPTPHFPQFEGNWKNPNLAGLINLRAVIIVYILTQDAIQ